jgi:hypothetical protein
MSATKLIDPSSFIRVPMVEEEDKTCHTCKKEARLGGLCCAMCDRFCGKEATHQDMYGNNYCDNGAACGDSSSEEEECVDDLVEEEYEQRCKALGEKPGDDYHVCDNLIHGDCPDGSVWHSDNVLKYNDEDLCLCPKCFFGDERKY